MVGDVKYLGLERDSGAVFNELNFQLPFRDMWLLARTHGDAQKRAAAMRREIHSLDPNVLMAVFAASALPLSAMGHSHGARCNAVGRPPPGDRPGLVAGDCGHRGRIGGGRRIDLVLGAVALVASLIPALRAARIDPVIALRHE